MDNTLLTPEDGVPFVNQVTMRLFCALGGHFTVATGRTMESAGRHLDSMTLSAPAILYGGGVIYDFEHDIRIRNTLLSKPSRAGRCAMYWRVFREWRGDYDRGRRHLRGAGQ